MKGSGAVREPALIRIRWRIFAFLFGFGFLAYVQQKSLTVAAERMMPDLGLSQVEIGWLMQAFVLGYGFFQMPGGIFGQHFGARRTLVIVGAAAFLAVFATPLLPSLLAGTGLFAAMLVAQLRFRPAYSRPGFRRTAGRSCRACKRWACSSAPRPRRRSLHHSCTHSAGSGRCFGPRFRGSD
jgi:hypothetical protein